MESRSLARRPDTDVRFKMNRILRGEAPRVLDLFSGAGGFSLGFLSAGYEMLGGLEIDASAALTYGWNIHGEPPSPEAPSPHSRTLDIAGYDPAEAIELLGGLQELAARSVDVLVGGPPCQPFSRSGRAKLKDIHDDPDAHLNDPRSRLYVSYLDYVERLKPLAVLVENVPDFLEFGGHNVAQEMCDVLSQLGYRSQYTLLNAAHYGVPQYRERMFLLAFRMELEAAPTFPPPTHLADLPDGYWRMREGMLFLSHPQQQSFLESMGFPTSPPGDGVAPPLPHSGLPKAVTVEEAIGDLPALKDGGRPHGRMSQLEGPEESVSPFAMLMRKWPGFESPQRTVYQHTTREPSSRDRRLFAALMPGHKYPDAHLLAERLYSDAVREGGDSTERDEYVPPYGRFSYPDKWRKLVPNRPSHTLPAHLSKDGYSHIHYDSTQARTITVREAARLQSFPDGFRFYGGLTASYRQIGNAVPPLLSYSLALAIGKALRGFSPDTKLLAVLNSN